MLKRRSKSKPWVLTPQEEKIYWELANSSVWDGLEGLISPKIIADIIKQREADQKSKTATLEGDERGESIKE